MFPSRQRDHFVANLKWLCSQKTSIAEVCRDTGINRQQFNRYLAGSAIPSALIMRRICDYFNVSENLILQPTENLQTALLDASPAADIQAFLSGLKFTNAKLLAGYYYRYQCSATPNANSVLRILYHVRATEHITRFKACRSLLEANGRHRRFRRHRLYGSILGHDTMTYFFEANQDGPSGVSIAVFGRPTPGPGQIRAGMILSSCNLRRGASRAALQYLGENIDIRSAILGCGYLDLRKHEIEPAILSLIAPRPGESLATLEAHPQISI